MLCVYNTVWIWIKTYRLLSKSLTDQTLENCDILNYNALRNIKFVLFQNAKPPPFQKVKLNASPGSTLLDLAWNPGNPLMLATCVSDGGVELFEIKENLHMVASLPVSTCATCCTFDFHLILFFPLFPVAAVALYYTGVFFILKA